jgi:hypothetical protein
LPLVSAAGATLLYYLINMGLLHFLRYPLPWPETIGKIVLPATVVNTLAMILIYPALHWLHKATGWEELAW